MGRRHQTCLLLQAFLLQGLVALLQALTLEAPVAQLKQHLMLALELPIHRALQTDHLRPHLIQPEFLAVLQKKPLELVVVAAAVA